MFLAAPLARFPVGALKIDQSFVPDMVVSPEDAAIVAATIALGHSLRLNVVAEGVERTEQLDCLRMHATGALAFRSARR